MTPERWRQVERIYLDALDQAPSTRYAYLQEVCGGDCELLGEVEELLSFQEESRNFIETTALEVAAREMAANAMDLSPGQTLDRYRIIRRLGAGGMGMVYTAEDSKLGRTVALKFLLDEFTGDRAALESLHHEARLLSAVNHPNICTVFDIAEWDGWTFISMEYVPGKPLDRLIGSNELRLSDTLRYAMQIAGGLAGAHAAGIIHRDLKPGNIIVTEAGDVKLLDFGLARLTPSRPTATETSVGTDRRGEPAGTIAGTASYMSPEQADGRRMDARADVFSFGVVLYEMVTGHRAFHEESAASTLSAILHGEPRPISEIVPSAPRELDAIIRRCLRKDPDRRFQTAADLKVALQEIREELDRGKLLPPAPVSPVRRRVSARLAAIVAFLLVAAAIAGIWFKGDSGWDSRGIRNRAMGMLRDRPLPGRKRIAVLPFTNVGEDPANQALSDGLIEVVSNSLTRLEQFQRFLVVVPASDVRGVNKARDADRLLDANLPNA